MELGAGSQINIPIAVLIWLMIYPMMLKIDFGSVLDVRKRPRGVLITLFVNWLVKPFSMALLGWVFFQHLFLPIIGPELADQYVAGTIILAAAPCTAMVFVWSYLTDGDPAYTLVQVSVNDLIMLVLFAPIVTLLVSGASNLTVPFPVLVYSVVAFIVIPSCSGASAGRSSSAPRGRVVREALRSVLPSRHRARAPGDARAHLRVPGGQHHRSLPARLLIAIPILIQVYFNSSLTYGLMYLPKVPHNVASPARSSGRATSSSWRWRRRSRSSDRTPARRWPPSSGCWSRCR
jgi:arsenite transporter